MTARSARLAAGIACGLLATACVVLTAVTRNPWATNDGREAIEIDAVEAGLREAVDRAVAPAHLTVWLRGTP